MKKMRCISVAMSLWANGNARKASEAVCTPFDKLSGINTGIFWPDCCWPRFVTLGSFHLCIIKSKHVKLRSDIHGKKKKGKEKISRVGGYFRHPQSLKIILRKNTKKNNFLHVSPDMLPGILGFIWNMQEERIMEPCCVHVVNIWLSFWLTWLCRRSLLKNGQKKKKKSCRTITIPVRRMIERGWLFDWTQKTEQFFIFFFFHNNILKVGHVHLSQSLSNNNSLRFTLIFKCCLSHLEWIQHQLGHVFFPPLSSKDCDTQPPRDESKLSCAGGPATRTVLAVNISEDAFKFPAFHTLNWDCISSHYTFMTRFSCCEVEGSIKARWLPQATDHSSSLRFDICQWEATGCLMMGPWGDLQPCLWWQ